MLAFGIKLDVLITELRVEKWKNKGSRLKRRLNQ